MTEITCSQADCTRKATCAGGLCKQHSILEKYGPVETWAECSVEACDSKVRYPGRDMCLKHHRRLLFHGSTEVTRSIIPRRAVRSGHRYNTVRVGKDHPLAKKDGTAYEHRVVLFDKIGPGEHPCHWCGRTVKWGAKPRTADALVVDHLNDESKDNRSENLVPACDRCNKARGTQRRHRALVAAGLWAKKDRYAAVRKQPVESQLASNPYDPDEQADLWHAWRFAYADAAEPASD